jgi:YHS domain-containing protein
MIDRTCDETRNDPDRGEEFVMNLRGNERLRVLLMGAVAAGVFGPQPMVNAGGPIPVLASSKKPSDAVAKPVVATVPPRLLPGTEAEAAMIRPVSQTDAAPAASSQKKSEVMRQLELLYKQDGREMPDLNTDIKPVPAPGTNGAATTESVAPAATSANTGRVPAPNGLRTQQPVMKPNTPAPEIAAPAPKSKNPVLAFFKKFLPGHKDPKPTKAPAEYRPDVAPVPPAGLASQSPAPYRQEAARQVGTVPVNGSVLPPLDNQPRSPFAGTADGIPNTLPQPLVSDGNVPPAPVGDLPLPAAQADLLPPLLADPRPTTVSNAPGSLDSNDKAPAGETNSPFSEMSEAEADKKLELNPFTGLTLDEEAGSANVPPGSSGTSTGSLGASNGSTGTPTVSSGTSSGTPNRAPDAVITPPSGAVPADDPFADELKKMGVVPPTADAATETPNLVPPKSDSPTFDGIEDQATREKMKKIHERGSMKGLKGFCPVTLRDERELVDAKPDFHSTFRGQKFHFADAEAKLKFDEEPARYAPAAYGADVVALTRDKDVVEGSLDFAAWFKGRLYLFGSQNSHDAFVADPSAYATPVGIE